MGRSILLGNMSKSSHDSVGFVNVNKIGKESEHRSESLIMETEEDCIVENINTDEGQDRKSHSSIILNSSEEEAAAMVALEAR